MQKQIFLLLGVFMVLGVSYPGFSQEEAVYPYGSLIAEYARVFEKGAGEYGLSLTYLENKVTTGGVQGKTKAFAPAAFVNYVVGENLELSALVPYTSYKYTETGGTGSVNASGLNDISLALKYQVKKFDESGAGLSLKLSFDTTNGDEKKYLGDGSDLEIKGIYTAHQENSNLHINLGYKMTGKYDNGYFYVNGALNQAAGYNNYDPGDVFSYAVGMDFAAGEGARYTLDLDGRNTGKGKLSNGTTDTTNRSTYNLSAGYKSAMGVNGEWSLGASFGLGKDENRDYDWFLTGGLKYKF